MIITLKMIHCLNCGTQEHITLIQKYVHPKSQETEYRGVLECQGCKRTTFVTESFRNKEACDWALDCYRALSIESIEKES